MIDFILSLVYKIMACESWPLFDGVSSQLGGGCYKFALPA